MTMDIGYLTYGLLKNDLNIKLKISDDHFISNFFIERARSASESFMQVRKRTCVVPLLLYLLLPLRLEETYKTVA